MIKLCLTTYLFLFSHTQRGWHTSYTPIIILKVLINTTEIKKNPIHILTAKIFYPTRIKITCCIITNFQRTKRNTTSKKKAISHIETANEEAPRFRDNRHMKVVTLLAQRTGYLYSPGYNLSHVESTPGPECGRIISTKNFNDTIGNRTGDLPSLRAVLQPTAPMHVHNNLLYIIHMHFVNKAHSLNLTTPSRAQACPSTSIQQIFVSIFPTKELARRFHSPNSSCIFCLYDPSYCIYSQIL